MDTPRRSHKVGIRRFIAAILVITLAQPPAANAADPTEVALSGLEFGGSIGKLLWTSVDTRNDVSRADADRYSKLAVEIKQQIELGRASSGLIQSNFNLIATSLGYAAMVDPEPLSRAVAGVAAWGAKKTGDAIGAMVLDESQKEAKKILAQGLKNSGLSASEIKNMTPQELSERVGDLRIGNEKLRDVLKDQPDSLSLLQAHAIDIATDIGVEALYRAEGTAADVQVIRQDLADTKARIDAYQNEVEGHLSRLETQVSGLETATKIANDKLDVLKNQVQGNSAAIQALAEISYAGWTTSQKLQAVRGGLFPQLAGSQKEALIESLKADLERERLVFGAQQAAQDFGNLATIAGNIGLPPDAVKALQGAQHIATGVAKFASGDYLGAVASVTSLVGLGAPDAAAERHAAMMQYLAQEFALVNKKLDTVIELQVRTLEALEKLAEKQRIFRLEVLGQLDRIEDTVLRSELVLQAVLLSRWTECFSLINGTPLNSQFSIPSRAVLTEIVANQNAASYAGSCYFTMTSFLDAWVKTARWSGQIIAATNFPSDSIANNAALQTSWNAFQRQKNRAYISATAFMRNALPDAPGVPAKYLARISQPVVNISYARELDALFEQPDLSQQFANFTCNQAGVLSQGLRDLICVGTVPNTVSRPIGTRWGELLDAALLGPHSIGLIDTGITLATLSDFARRTGATSFDFVRPEAIANFAQNGPTNELKEALRQHKGIDLLVKLQWLSESMVLQQSLAYGDFIAKLIERELYDPATKSLRSTAQTPSQQLALEAMRWNPVLARNVVMIAMRHSIEDSMGGLKQAEAVRHRQTYYHLALKDFAQTCDGSSLARAKLGELFHNWSFEYRVTSAQKQDALLKGCPEELRPDLASNTPLPEFGAGVAVSFGDFYVVVPTPMELSSGIFEQSDSLRLALRYRDRVNQEIIDRTVLKTVKSVVPASDAGRTALMLLNEGWDWQPQKTTE